MAENKLAYFGLDEMPVLESRAERIIEWLRTNMICFQ